MNLKISYFIDTDTLSIWSGMPASEAGNVTQNLIADYDAEGEIVGFTLDHAAELLLNIPFQTGMDYGYETISSSDPDAYNHYVKDGALTLVNLNAVKFSNQVSENLTAHYGDDGDAVGFTLLHAAELLLPYLKGEVTTQDMRTSAGAAADND
ncbi:MAG: DUF2283 domain-containing protein [Chloroflexota bacterium]|nr:DUF2283 domain-containing protein [Chloroflexota bacterium]MDE2687152.1 DUF2283 domain-containing protein [Chloroflexota bacterium]